MNPTSFCPLLILPIVALLGVSPVNADEIKLKNGETVNGRITYEADDIVKIEVAVSETIKQTKVIGRNEILEIIKDAPDNVAFAKIQKMVPTPSRLPASQYETMLQTGPTAFLRDFPDSPHAGRVREIGDTLATELDKVERGFLKIEDEWISPQDRAEFASLTASKIALLNMKEAARARNYNGYINALRQYQVLEDNHMGSPAFVVALQAAREIIPALGNQLQGMLRNVEYLNQQYEQNLAAMDEVSRAQVAAARQKEIDSYNAGVETDKKNGIKWFRLDRRSPKAIESYLKLAGSELTRIREYDVEALEKQAGMLVNADRQASAGELAAARATLKEAAALTGASTGSRRGSSKSYLASISSKITEREEEAREKAKAREAALASEALTANLKGSEDGTEKEETPVEGEEGEKTGGKEGEAAATETEVAGEKKAEPVDDFAALANVGKGDKKGKAEEPGKKKSKPKPREREEREEEDRPSPVVVDEGGGLSISRIIQIVTGLLLITVVALKFLGGGKKE